MGSRRSRLREDLEESRYVIVVLWDLSSINIRKVFLWKSWNIGVKYICRERVYVDSDGDRSVFPCPLHV